LIIIMKKYSVLSITAFLFLLSPLPLQAQQENISFYQHFAPIDLTGNWVSVVTEDWHTRMVMPERENFDGLPLTQQAQEKALATNLDALEEQGQACVAYGAARIMREPVRLKIYWEDADTLRIDTDSGQQTRLFHFANAPSSIASSPQGLSVAQWQYNVGFDPVRTQFVFEQNGFSTQGTDLVLPDSGKLYVKTDNLTEGMLRKNGAPTSTQAVVEEYFNIISGPDNNDWLIVTTIVHDPVNLLVDHVTSSNFRRENDDSKWNPQPCRLY